MSFPLKRTPDQFEQRLSTALRYVREYTRIHGYAPSVREIADHLERSVATTHEALVALRRRGQIDWDDSRVKSRTIRVVT